MPLPAIGGVQGAIKQTGQLSGNFAMQVWRMGDRGVMCGAQQRTLFRKWVRVDLVDQACRRAQAQLRHTRGELLFENYSRLSEQSLGVQINQANLGGGEKGYTNVQWTFVL